MTINAVMAKPVTENPATAVVGADGVVLVVVAACVVSFETPVVSVTSISPVVRSTTRSAGVVTSISTLETSVSGIKELVIMLSFSAVVRGNVSTTAVVSDGDKLLVVVVDVLVVRVFVVVLISIVRIFVFVLVFSVVLIRVVLLLVELVVVLVVGTMVLVAVVVVLVVEVVTGEEVVDLFGTGINTATELSSIIGFLLVLSVSSVSIGWLLLFSRALIAFSIAFVNAS